MNTAPTTSTTPASSAGLKTMSSPTQQFTGLTQDTWTCWDSNLVSTLSSKGCDQISFSGGDSGTLNFHHTVPFSNGQFAFTYDYDGSSSTLTLTITDSPSDISNSTIFNAVNSLIYTCPAGNIDLGSLGAA